MPTEKINIVYVDINDLQNADYNPRKATEKEFNDLKANIAKFGFVDPVIVNSNADRHNIIIGGHFRVRVAKSLNIKTVPVVYLDIADIAKEKELNVRLNKNTGTFDFDILANLFDEADLKDWGFTELDIPSLSGHADTNFDLPDGDKGNLEQITFTLSKEQAERIREVLAMVEGTDLFKFTETYGNTNSNGNALYTLANNYNGNVS